MGGEKIVRWSEVFGECRREGAGGKGEGSEEEKGR